MGNFSDTHLLLQIAAAAFRRRLPGQVIIQMTDRCNATCPHCGMRVTSRFDRSRLSVDDIKRIIDAAAQNGVQALSFTGGEPMMLLDDLAHLIRYAGNAGIRFIRTGTNGYFMAGSDRDPDAFKARISRIAALLADTPLRNFWISIDSCEPEVHEKMRGFPGVIRGIEKAMPIFHEHGLYPSVNLGVNRNVGGALTAELDARDYRDPKAYLEAFYKRYLRALQKFYRRVIDMGFTILNTCYPMSVDSDSTGGMQAVYAATAADRVVRFSAEEKAVLFHILMKCVLQFRNQIRIFSPLTSLFTLQRHYQGSLPQQHPAAACRGGIDFFFIDAHKGETFPCGYRGNESFGKYWSLQTSRLDRRKECRLCDWECFRDPSEQAAPFLQAASEPWKILQRMRNDRQYLRYWLSDMRYYRACRFFDGRRLPAWDALRKTTASFRRSAGVLEKSLFSSTQLISSKYYHSLTEL